MVLAQAQHPTHLQLFLAAVGDTNPPVAAGDVSLLSDESSGARYSGWASATPDSFPPPARSAGSIIYDQLNNRFVLYGGNAQGGRAQDVWVCDAGPSSRWTQVSPPGTGPGPRMWHSAIYDPIRQRMLVFGGYNSDVVDNAVYALSLTTGSEAWSVLVPAGAGPAGRYAFSAIYDPVGDRMIVYGGFAPNPVNDAWSLPLNVGGTPTWSTLPSNPFGAQYWHSAVYDAPGQRMVTFGGFNGADQTHQLYALSLTGTPTWSEILPSGAAPPPLVGSHTEVDATTNLMTVLGGQLVGSGQRNSRIWSLPLTTPSTWVESTPFGGSAISARVDPMGPPQSVGGYNYLFGGSDQSNNLYNDLLALPSARGSAGGLIPLAVTPGWLPTSLALRLGPNPFRSTTSFTLALPAREPVLVSIYDIAGRLLRRIDAGTRGPGEVTIPWNGLDSGGRLVRAGFYLVRARAGESVVTAKVIRLN
jgi:hypothetical protein